jgi:hypothetical protein
MKNEFNIIIYSLLSFLILKIKIEFYHLNKTLKIFYRLFVKSTLNNYEIFNLRFFL